MAHRRQRRRESATASCVPSASSSTRGSGQEVRSAASRCRRSRPGREEREHIGRAVEKTREPAGPVRATSPDCDGPSVHRRRNRIRRREDRAAGATGAAADASARPVPDATTDAEPSASTPPVAARSPAGRKRRDTARDRSRRDDRRRDRAGHRPAPVSGQRRCSSRCRDRRLRPRVTAHEPGRCRPGTPGRTAPPPPRRTGAGRRAIPFVSVRPSTR